jgi:aspartate ammonia-lyase
MPSSTTCIEHDLIAANEALESGDGILELVREKHLLTDKQIDESLNPAALTGQGR